MSNVLSGWQDRRAEILSSYDVIIKHLQGKKIPTDGLSRRPNYEIGYDHVTAKLLPTLAATTITELCDDLLPDIKAAQETAILVTEIEPSLVDVSTACWSQWRSIYRARTYERRIYMPTELRRPVTSLFHNNPESGYCVALKTAEHES
jgi:hypothetical protein